MIIHYAVDYAGGLEGKERGCAFLLFSPCLLSYRVDMKHPDPALQRPDLACAGSVASVRQQVREIVAVHGRNRAKVLLGVPRLTLNSWVEGWRTPSRGCARAILLVWLLYVRRIVPNEFDLSTGARFAIACGNDTPSSGSNSDCGALENSTNT